MSLSIPPGEPITLLPTKLYRPRPGHDLIARPQLIERLNRGLKRKLTLITAPAGYGKTTLVSAWLAQLAEEQAGRGAEEPGSRGDFSPAPPPPAPLLRRPGFRWMNMTTTWASFCATSSPPCRLFFLRPAPTP